MPWLLCANELHKMEILVGRQVTSTAWNEARCPRRHWESVDFCDITACFGYNENMCHHLAAAPPRQTRARPVRHCFHTHAIQREHGPPIGLHHVFAGTLNRLLSRRPCLPLVPPALCMCAYVHVCMCSAVSTHLKQQRHERC